MNLGFWKGKRVFLTGHTGFKGSWLSLWLQSAGAKVKGYSLAPPTVPNLYETAKVSAGMETYQGDVRDYARLQKSVADFLPEIVIHMAAQSLVRASYVDPLETYSTNVMGTANILESVRRIEGVRAVLVVTSDKCYSNRDGGAPFKEDAPLGGFDPYSSSKGAAELVTSAYRDSYFSGETGRVLGTSIASARAGNVIGGGDWASDRLIPDLVRGFSAGRPVSLRNPHAIRPWQHVLEPIAGYLLLLEKLMEQQESFAGAWNFGPNSEDERTVGWIADAVARSWGDGAKWEHESSHQPHEAPVLRLDCRKAKELLGWQPRLPLEEALEWTLAWYRAHHDRSDLREECLRQIQTYQQRKAIADCPSPAAELSAKGKL